MKLTAMKNQMAKGASALERAKKRLAARKEAEKTSGETFTEAMVCASTGKPYALLWHRENDNEYF